MNVDDAPDEDVMQQRWCCLTCSSTFGFGKLRLGPTGMLCPTCESGDIHPATGEVTELDAYFGEVGTLN